MSFESELDEYLGSREIPNIVWDAISEISAGRDRYKKALEEIASYKDNCLIGPNTDVSTPMGGDDYASGSNAAFNSVASEAQAALDHENNSQEEEK